jgi:hypothetical protein
MAVRREPEVEVQTRVEQEKTLVMWTAPSRPYRKVGKQVLTVPMVIAILVGLILLVAGEWMLIAVVVALCFAYYTWTMMVPEEAEFSLTTRGVRLHGKLYEWPVLSRWWIDEKWGQSLLIVETGAVAIGRLVMPLSSKDENKVTEIMEKSLLKEKPSPTVLDRMGKWLTEKFPLEERV